MLLEKYWINGYNFPPFKVMALKIKKSHITHYSSSFARFLKPKKIRMKGNNTEYFLTVSLTLQK